MKISKWLVVIGCLLSVLNVGVYADDAVPTQVESPDNLENGSTLPDGNSNEPLGITSEVTVPMSELVGNAVAGAEVASEVAGVDYYGRDRSGILGNRLWFIDVGAVFSSSDGDGLEVDTGPTFSTGFNLPLAKHFDFGVGIGYSQQSGTLQYYKQVPYTVYDRYYGWYYYYSIPRTAYRTVLVREDFDLKTFSGNATLAISLAPGKLANPFIIGGGYYIYQDIEIGDYSDNVNELGFLVGGGIEFSLGKEVSVIPSIIYSEVDDADETSINLLFAYWYAFRHAFRVSGSYGTESEAFGANLGWMYSF